jgi:hypothetical protein
MHGEGGKGRPADRIVLGRKWHFSSGWNSLFVRSVQGFGSISRGRWWRGRIVTLGRLLEVGWHLVLIVGSSGVWLFFLLLLEWLGSSADRGRR